MKTRPNCLAVCRLALSGLVLGVAAGCHALHLEPIGGDKLDKVAKDGQAAQAPALPGKFQRRISQYVFLSDFELNPNSPLFRELANLRDQVYKELQLPSANTLVNVYLFEDRDRYERFMRSKYPDLPKRRAFFVAQPRVGASEELLVYTYWGDRIQEDLRHELTHALLHSVLKDVPLWLDEGLAEYFEVPPEAKGINQRHIEQLRHASQVPFKPDLGRLEQLSQVQEMTPAEYREAWAWVHLMLHDKPEAKTALINYLQQLRVNATPGPIQPRLATIYPALTDALTKHLGQLDLAASPERAQIPQRVQ
jgi:Protein of unknown function (DUF1570)